jgi:lysozyme
MDQKYGIDVSHWQSTTAPGGVPWSLLKQSGCEFAMVRACYGTSRDDKAVEHVRNARAVGMAVGLYHFFRIAQPVTDQLAAFNAQALACGIRVGDIAPACDVEDDGTKGPKIEPAWSDATEVFVSGLVANFGEAIVYITQRDFGRLGKPAWVLARPLWVAHYTGAAKPATPANADWAIWQHRVGPYVVNGPGGAYAANGTPASAENGPPGPLDQNRAQRLPQCTRVPGATGSMPPPASGPAPDYAHQDLTAARWDALTVALRDGLDLAGDREWEPYQGDGKAVS